MSIHRRHKKWSAEQDEALARAIADRVSLQRLAVRFKTSKGGIVARANILGLKIAAPRRLSQKDLGFNPR